MKNKHSHLGRMKEIMEGVKIEVEVRMEEEEEEDIMEEEEVEIRILMVTKPIVQVQEDDLIKEVDEETRRVCNRKCRFKQVSNNSRSTNYGE